MDPYRNTPSSSFLPANDHDDNTDPTFMKAPKRKRLAKACDACHKSKRRCDGTAPCSNCYYASKACSYTDSSGRPVPAPRPHKSERQDSDHRTAQLSSSSSLPTPPSHDREHEEDDLPKALNHPPMHTDIPRKRFRNERGNAIPTEDISTPLLPVVDHFDRSMGLDHALTRELTNLFFTHCHPARIVIHKPTFSTLLSHNRVPTYLLHAVCALAAPLSRQPRLRTSPSRFAGKQFAQEAVSLMFDSAGQLSCERNLETAQALCILQFHDIMTKGKDMYWSTHYHDIALQVVEFLNVYQPDYPTLTPVPSPDFIQNSIERESVRRIFWLIHITDIMRRVFFKQPAGNLGEQGMRLRLPADETSFELGVHSTLPEYLYLPAVRTQYSSEFGHLIRVVTIHAKLEQAVEQLDATLDLDPAANPTTALIEADQAMDVCVSYSFPEAKSHSSMQSWVNSLPDHLRFSEQSLQVQQSMFETSSNSGAWCFCLMHVVHATSALALNYARHRSQRGPKSEPHWALQTFDMIMTMLGDRAKNSIIMGALLWALIKYCKRDDKQIRDWHAEYEDSWGTRVRELVEWKLSTPPSVQRRHSPTSQAQQSPHLLQQQLSHRRSAEAWSSNPPVSSLRLQHDLSYNHRSPSDNTPTILPLGRPRDDPRLHSKSGGTHDLSSHPQPQPDGDGGGRVISGSVLGKSGNVSINNENEKEREAVARRLVHDSAIDPALKDGVGEGASQDNVESRDAGGSGDSPQSLPSLKSSGLLDWTSRMNGGMPKQLVHGNATSHSNPHPYPPPTHDEDVRSTTLVSTMPVGLQWLANESR
ncbi:hypothetical protein L208DRAFT_1368129 [Tricholoma matsutake]|nr:hypothetical protein L208DRAFT_1368129 [Tricholoma matsutake 945]